jgi:hypothetical protein
MPFYQFTPFGTAAEVEELEADLRALLPAYLALEYVAGIRFKQIHDLRQLGELIRADASTRLRQVDHCAELAVSTVAPHHLAGDANFKSWSCPVVHDSNSICRYRKALPRAYARRRQSVRGHEIVDGYVVPSCDAIKGIARLDDNDRRGGCGGANRSGNEPVALRLIAFVLLATSEEQADCDDDTGHHKRANMRRVDGRTFRTHGRQLSSGTRLVDCDA